MVAAIIRAMLSLPSVDDTALMTDDAAAWAWQTYGPEMTFTIHRKGDMIGTHRISFDKQDDHIIVDSSTDLKVPFLFMTLYSLDYNAREKWLKGALKSIRTDTNDGGDKSAFNIHYQGDDSATLPTNHWNPNVIKVDQVFNTLTGNIMQVTISHQGMETIDSWQGPINANRYDYSGDLQDVSVWYDQQFRWVGLRFKGTDGSTIHYKCRKCGR